MTPLEKSIITPFKIRQDEIRRISRQSLTVRKIYVSNQRTHTLSLPTAPIDTYVIMTVMWAGYLISDVRQSHKWLNWTTLNDTSNLPEATFVFTTLDTVWSKTGLVRNITNLFISQEQHICLSIHFMYAIEGTIS